MNFRWFLELQGLSPKDIEDAVNEARQVVRVTRGVADFGATMLTKLAEKSKPGKKQQILAVGALVAEKLRDGANGMLTHSSRVEAPPPPRAPSDKQRCICYDGYSYCLRDNGHKGEHHFNQVHKK